MGYVRMIRSGAMLYTSNSIQFVPDLNNIETNKFEEMTTADNLSPDTIASAKYARTDHPFISLTF
jgi:hypothetical protein